MFGETNMKTSDQEVKWYILVSEAKEKYWKKGKALNLTEITNLPSQAIRSLVNSSLPFTAIFDSLSQSAQSVLVLASNSFLKFDDSNYATTL